MLKIKHKSISAMVSQKKPIKPAFNAIDGAPNGIRTREIKITQQEASLFCGAEDLQLLDRGNATRLQAILQHGDQFGCWATPSKWNSRLATPALMHIDLRRRIINFLPARAKLTVSNTNDEHFKELSMLGIVPYALSSICVEEIVQGAILTFTRYLILLRMGPAGHGRRGASEPLDPSHIAGIAYSVLPPLFAIAINKRLENEVKKLFSTGLPARPVGEEADYLKLINGQDIIQMNMAESMKRRIHLETRRANRLAERGYWNDPPEIRQSPTAVTKVAGPALKREAQRTIDRHTPFPDAYISEMGQRSLWIIRDLGPNLLKILQEISKIWHRTDVPGLKDAGVQARRQSDIRKLLSEYEWEDRDGGPIKSLHFPLIFSQVGKSTPSRARKTYNLDFDDALPPAKKVTAEESGNTPLTSVWPPRVFIDIIGLARNLQFAHLFVLALSTGARRSELLNLTRTCLKQGRDGFPFASGRTFKLARQHDGQIREWTLPSVAVEALEQQVRLVGLLEGIGPQKPVRGDGKTFVNKENRQHLWFRPGVATGERAEALTDLNKALLSYANTLAMEVRPGGQALRSHRFRKTVVRLAALALTQAPKILMDVFGHNSIEMTLYYILSDTDLQSEIEQVSRELRVMRATSIVNDIVNEEDSHYLELDNGGFGGPAALTIANAVRNRTREMHSQGRTWGAESAVELAEILTLNGRAWNYVREGVICTKFPGTESGPCNMSRGLPEPSRCQTSCSHRLEERFARQDVNVAIQKCVEAFTASCEEGDELAQAMWKGQIRIHLDRFDDLREKWAELPILKKILAETEGG